MKPSRAPSSLQIGDRVERKEAPLGPKGPGVIINYVPHITQQYLVQFDTEFRGGHTGNGVGDVLARRGHGWWCTASGLEFVSRPHPMDDGLEEYNAIIQGMELVNGA